MENIDVALVVQLSSGRPLTPGLVQNPSSVISEAPSCSSLGSSTSSDNISTIAIRKGYKPLRSDRIFDIEFDPDRRIGTVILTGNRVCFIMFRNVSLERAQIQGLYGLGGPRTDLHLEDMSKFMIFVGGNRTIEGKPPYICIKGRDGILKWVTELILISPHYSEHTNLKGIMKDQKLKTSFDKLMAYFDCCLYNELVNPKKGCINSRMEFWGKCQAEFKLIGEYIISFEEIKTKKLNAGVKIGIWREYIFKLL